MANSEDKKLAIDVLARIDKLEKGMAKAASVVDKQSRAMELRTAKATKAMESSYTGLSTKAVGALTRLGAAGLAAGVSALAFGAIIDKTTQALDEFGRIADQSAQAGLDSEFFQTLAYQASLAGVSVEELSGALNSFNKNSGLAVAAKGKMVATLKKLNPALLENIRNASDQAERVKLAASAIDQAKTASEKAAISTTLFGDAGAKLVPVFEGGAAAISSMAAQAKSMGLIVDRELIARADELGDEFETATRIMDLQFKQALVNLAPVLVESARLAGLVALGITAMVDSMRDLENQSTRGLQQQIAAIGKQRLDIENQIIAKQEEQRQEVSKMSDVAKNLGFDNTKNPVLPGPGAVDELQKQNDELKRQETLMVSILSTRREAAESVNGAKAVTAAAPLAPISDATGGSTRNKAAEDAIRQAKAVTDLIADLEFERSQIGKTATEQAAANALRTAGTAATEEQRKKIIALVNATAAEAAAVEATKARLDEAKTAATSFATTFRQGLVAGESAAKSFQNALLQLLDSVATKLESLAVDKLFAGLLGGAIPGIGGAVIGGVSGAGGSAVGKVAAPSVAKVLASAPKMPTIRRPAAVNDNLNVSVSVDDDGAIKAYVRRANGEVLAASDAAHKKYARGQGKTDARDAVKNPRRR